MTMPHERTRSLRWTWECLNQWQDAPNLTPEEQARVKAILRHYPSGKEIKQWAGEQVAYAARVRPSYVQLEPEDAELLADQRVEGVPEHLERGETTPEQRTWALQEAFMLWKFSDVAWTAEQRREIPYLLRHFPEPHTLGFWARHEAKDPAFRRWVGTVAEDVAVEV